MSTAIFTKVLREKLKKFFVTEYPEMTELDIQSILSSYASHSMRRGGGSTAKREGATEEEIMELGGWDRAETKDGYMAKEITGETQAYKRMRLF